MLDKLIKMRVIVDCNYHRDQFDDWLAGGKLEYKGKIYHWAAQNTNYGFGWEIEPITDQDWADVSEDEVNMIIVLIEKCLCEHKSEYVI